MTETVNNSLCSFRIVNVTINNLKGNDSNGKDNQERKAALWQ